MTLPVSDDQHLWVNWDDYHRSVDRLALLVYESGWTFDMILCLARGGLRVGDQLSRIFDLPLAILATSSYREAAGTQQGELDIAEYITVTRGSLGGNVLLVDDLVDSGVTLARVQQHLASRFPAIGTVRSAVLWYKACSVVKPDYFVTHLPNNPWIHQPFEAWDAVRPHHLAAWINRGSGRERPGAGSDHATPVLPD
jgi:hypoxanthine phosphoribosyltransferase